MTIGYKNVAILNKLSGLPVDQVVNDWYTNTVLDVVGVYNALLTFYQGLYTNFSQSMGGNLTVNQYAIPNTPPAPGIGFGPPIGTHTGFIGAPGTAGLPAQVAAVLSFHADFTGVPEHGPAGTRPRATRRGRVYLGELSTVVLQSETTGGKEIEFTDTFLGQLASAASTLKGTPSLGWSVFSKKNWALYPVVGGWVDDSPDTTRRRKVQADSRTNWS